MWWENAADPVDLLAQGRVVMTSVYNGRIQAAIDDGDDHLNILWDGQVQDVEVWTVPAGTRKAEAARSFIAFSSEPERMAVQASHIAYGLARRSALDFVAPRHL